MAWRQIGLGWLAAISLAACLSAGKKGSEQALEVFDLGVPEAVMAKVRQQPMALEVKVPVWLDSLGIDYRLAYEDEQRLREYARSRWAAPPAQLVQQRLMHRLGLVASGQVKASCLLRLEIDEFSQLFVTPEKSHVLVLGRAHWLDRQRQILATQAIRIEEASARPDAIGGVQALSRALGRLADELEQGESRFAALGVCR